MNLSSAPYQPPAGRCPGCDKPIELDPATPPNEAACPLCGHAIWFPPLPAIAAFDFMVPEASICRMEARTMEDAIGTLVDRLAATGHVPTRSADDVTAAFIRREQLGSTAIGAGCAVPHVKHPAIADLVGTIGYSVQGIDFHSLDGELVHIVILLISPPNQPGDHLRALERISRFFRGLI